MPGIELPVKGGTPYNIHVTINAHSIGSLSLFESKADANDAKTVYNTHSAKESEDDVSAKSQKNPFESQDNPRQQQGPGFKEASFADRVRQHLGDPVIV